MIVQRRSQRPPPLHPSAVAAAIPSPIIGRYRAQRIVSEGPFSIVLEARPLEAAGLVVLKLLPPHLREDPGSAWRLSREAHVLVRVAGQHVVRLLDTGWTAQAGPHLVLEYLAGQDLGRLLAESGPMPWPVAVSYILQACEGLAVAHDAGIWHCDLKPDNLFAVATGRQPLLKLLDFGICRCSPQTFPWRDIGAVEDTHDELLGTPPYLSPERVLESATLDQRSDIWSLGVILHELLTGKPLFGAATPKETCLRIIKHRFQLESDPSILPVPLRIIVARCLARKPAHRYQHVRELAQALERLPLPGSFRGQLTGKFRREGGHQA